MLRLKGIPASFSSPQSAANLNAVLTTCQNLLDQPEDTFLSCNVLIHILPGNQIKESLLCSASCWYQ